MVKVLSKWREGLEALDAGCRRLPSSLLESAVQHRALYRSLVGASDGKAAWVLMDFQRVDSNSVNEQMLVAGRGVVEAVACPLPMSRGSASDWWNVKNCPSSRLLLLKPLGVLRVRVPHNGLRLPLEPAQSIGLCVPAEHLSH